MQPLLLTDLQSVDSRPLLGATPDMLDLSRVAEHILGATRRGRYQGTSDPEQYLAEHGCVASHEGALVPTLAGLICFGRDPQAVLPRAVVDIGHYRGVEAISYEVIHLEKDIGGTIFDQLTQIERYLWSNTHHGMTLANDSLQRIEIHEYPRAVIRELIVNMLVHRDYTNFHAASRVFLFRNRIEWVSPGGLPAGITVEKLLGQQFARNPRILTVLYESGYVEAIGQGLRTVVANLRQAEMLAPEFEDTGSAFRVIVYGKAIDIDAGIGLFEQLTPFQRRILSHLRTRGELPVQDIYGLFQSRSERSIQRDLTSLIDMGLISSSGYGKSKRYYINEQAQEITPFPS